MQQKKYKISVYSLASKFVLDNGLIVGNQVIIFPTNCKVSSEKTPNPEVFIDKLPRPNYKTYTFADKSYMSIGVNGIFNGIIGAYTWKKVVSVDEFIVCQNENEKYDNLTTKF